MEVSKYGKKGGSANGAQLYLLVGRCGDGKEETVADAIWCKKKKLTKECW